MPCRPPRGGRNVFHGTTTGMAWSAEVISILWMQYENPPCEAKVVGSDPGTGKQEIGIIIFSMVNCSKLALNFHISAQYVIHNILGYHVVCVVTPGKLELSCHVTLKLTLRSGNRDAGPFHPIWSSLDASNTSKMGMRGSSGVVGTI